MTTNQPQTTSIEGVSKRGDCYRYIIAVPETLRSAITVDKVVQVEDTPVTITSFDGEYATFALSLAELAETSLAELEVGSEVLLHV